MKKPEIISRQVNRKDLLDFIDSYHYKMIKFKGYNIIKNSLIVIELCGLNNSIFEGCIVTLDENEDAFYFEESNILILYDNINEDIVTEIIYKNVILDLVFIKRKEKKNAGNNGN